MGELIATHGKVGGTIGIHPVPGQVVTSYLGARRAIIGLPFNEEDGFNAGLRAQRALIRPNALAQQEAIPAVERHVCRHRAGLALERATDLFQILQRIGHDRDSTLGASQRFTHQ